MRPSSIALACAAALSLAAPAIAQTDRHQGAQAGMDRQGMGQQTGARQGMHPRHDAATVRSVQQALQDKGFDVGTIDGVMGPRTSAALREYQQAQGIDASGMLDQQTLSRLDVAAAGGASGAGTPAADRSRTGGTSAATSGKPGGGGTQSGAAPGTPGGSDTSGSSTSSGSASAGKDGSGGTQSGTSPDAMRSGSASGGVTGGGAGRGGGG